MTQESYKHPIAPPPELVQQWMTEYTETKANCLGTEFIAAQAAQYGADQELLACGNYLKQCAAWEEEDVTEFYNYRRPRPLSLKELALKALDAVHVFGNEGDRDAIRRALEQIND